MSKQSAGILLYRFQNNTPEVFLVHPGGPFWAKKDKNTWSVPKGEFTNEESAHDAALREFEEETGVRIECKMTELSPVRQKSGKTVYCFTCRGDIDPSGIKSNTFEMEWPPRSGRKQSFPEVDRAGWFGFTPARTKILEYQLPLLNELESMITSNMIS
jgi:predicted NUDIX family NTP pyrophosphohydrolase